MFTSAPVPGYFAAVIGGFAPIFARLPLFIQFAQALYGKVLWSAVHPS